MSSGIIPAIRYDDARRAVGWLQEAFGFKAGLVVDGEDGQVVHAQLRHGAGMVMVSSPGDGPYDELFSDRAGPSMLIGERPVHIEDVQLKVVVVYDDGSSETRAVEIQTETGEIQPIEQRQSSLGPQMFGEQFNATEMQADEGLDGLSALLKKRA